LTGDLGKQEVLEDNGIRSQGQRC